MFSQTDGPSFQSPVRIFSVLVFCLLLTHSCKASDAVFSPVIRLLGIDRTRGGVKLNCESKGWPLKPEVFWLDSDGKVLPSGPTETVKGPDDLYTVSSIVTSEKRHINSFNCRVQHMDISETRETQIYIADDFFEVQSRSSAPTVGLAVCLAVCILIILLLVFLIIKTKKTHRDETDNNCPKSNKTQDEFVTEEERERELLRTNETVEMKVFNKEKGGKKSKHLKKQQHQEEQLREQQRREEQLREQQRREEAENRVETLKDELETKKNEVEIKQTELQRLVEDKLSNEMELQHLKEELQNKNKEMETIEATLAQPSRLFWGRIKEEDQKKKREAEKEVETLKKKLETQEEELDTTIKELEAKQAEIPRLQDEIQRIEADLQTLMDELKSINIEIESDEASSSSVSGHVQFKWPIISRQKFQDEQQRREEAENKVQILEERLQTMSTRLEKQLWDQKQREERAEKERNQLVKKLQEETMKREKAEKEVETLKMS